MDADRLQQNNRCGGCQDEDCGLTDYGRLIIDEMERRRDGALLFAHRLLTAREAIEYSKKP